MNQADPTTTAGPRPLALYPWQQGVWSRIIAPALARDELHHGLLVSGGEGLGKARFADVLMAALLCEQRDSDALPCGRCRGCHLFANDTHPDVVRLEVAGGRLGVDQIRALSTRVNLSSQYGGARVGLVNPADRLTVNAANSLLKTLEEPPAGAYLLLVTSRPSRLPATVRSRCQIVALRAPDSAEATAWLAAQGYDDDARWLLPLAGGAPLKAADMAAGGDARSLAELMDSLVQIATGRLDPVTAAQAWKDKGAAPRLVDWVELLAMDLARAAVAGPQRLRIWDPVRIPEPLQGLSSAAMQSFLLWLGEARRSLEQPLNDQLLAESLFIRWGRAARAPGPGRPDRGKLEVRATRTATSRDYDGVG